MTNSERAQTDSDENATDVVIGPVSESDAGEVLTLQRAAFVSEAQIYGSADMPPLTQTLPEVEAELRSSTGLTARQNGRVVGVIRWHRTHSAGRSRAFVDGP